MCLHRSLHIVCGQRLDLLMQPRPKGQGAIVLEAAGQLVGQLLVRRRRVFSSVVSMSSKNESMRLSTEW